MYPQDQIFVCCAFSLMEVRFDDPSIALGTHEKHTRQKTKVQTVTEMPFHHLHNINPSTSRLHAQSNQKLIAADAIHSSVKSSNHAHARARTDKIRTLSECCGSRQSKTSAAAKDQHANCSHEIAWYATPDLKTQCDDPQYYAATKGRYPL